MVINKALTLIVVVLSVAVLGLSPENMFILHSMATSTAVHAVKQGVKKKEHGTFTDPRDGTSYKWVQIGDQIWMAQNLAYLPLVDDIATFASDDNPRYRVFGYDGVYVSDAKASFNYRVYGVLYNWSAAMAGETTRGAQGICPTGWHLPSDDEWQTLEMYLGMTSVDANRTGYRGTDEGRHLKAKLDWIYGGNGTNLTGFAGLPGGYCDSYGIHFYEGYGGSWWSSTPYRKKFAYYRTLYYNNTFVYRGNCNRYNGRSVRCVKN